VVLRLLVYREIQTEIPEKDLRSTDIENLFRVFTRRLTEKMSWIISDGSVNDKGMEVL